MTNDRVVDWSHSRMKTRKFLLLVLPTRSLFAVAMNVYSLLATSLLRPPGLFVGSVAALQMSARKGPAKVCVVGGGASGIFASIHASCPGITTVTVLEASRNTLTKVKISGGGRCNVLHDSSKSATELLAGYPRGKKELRGMLTKHFPATSAAAWFEENGVKLKTESDGRMFPTTDSSKTVIDALLNAADKANVDIRKGSKVERIEKVDGGASFRVSFTQKRGGDHDKLEMSETFDAVIMATGSAPAGYVLTRDLGIDFVDTVPSLFTLSTKHAVKEGGLLHSLSGVSVKNGRVSFRLPEPKENVPPRKKRKKAKWLQQEGPILITHHGLSGPAALKLSAFGAREFATANYRGDLLIHWAPDLGSVEEIFEQLWKITASNPKKAVSSQCPLLLKADDGGSMVAVPKRLWSSLVEAAGLEGAVWGQAPKKLVRRLAEQIGACSLEMTGKGTFKEEFVTAGGVSLKALDMKTMQSRKCDGLFFCGELINVDGVTGGYNFLNCWSTGFIAGTSAAQYCTQHNN